MDDLTRLSDDDLRQLMSDKIDGAHAMMEEYAAGSNALNYGWDWPTFNVLFPDQAAQIRLVRNEGRRRGLH